MASFTPIGVEAQVKGFSSFMGSLGKMDKGISSFGKTSTGVAKGGIATLGKGIAALGAAAVAAGAVGFAALGAGLIASTKTAISFESAFAGVLKTTNGLTDNLGNLNKQGEELRKGFVELSKVVPLPFEELASIGELGGQLGIVESDLLGFTKTVAELGTATNLSTEEAATGLARFSSIFKSTVDELGITTAENINKLGSSLVLLGNNLETNEAAILSFSERLAGAANIAGISQAGVLGISAAFSSVGITAEAGGTAASTALLEITNAINGASTGFVDNTSAIEGNVGKLQKLNAESARLEAQFPGLQAELKQNFKDFVAAGGSAEDFGRQLGDKTRQKAFQTAVAIEKLSDETQVLRDNQGKPVDSGQLAKFAQVAGMTADEFKAAWEEDADQAFVSFVEGLGRQGDRGGQVLDELGLGSSQATRAFLSLAGAGDKLEVAMKLANQGFEDGTFASQEAAQRFKTTEAQMQILKNTFRAMGDTIGSRFLPFLVKAIEIGKNFIDQWADPVANILDNVVVPAINKVIEAFNKFGIRGAAISILGQFGLGPDQVAIALSVIDNIIAGISNFFTTIQGLIAAFSAGGAGGVLASLFNVESVEEVFGIILAKIPELLQGLITSITTFLSTQGPVIGETLRQWATNFWDWVSDVVTGAGVALAAVTIAIGAWVASDAGQGQILMLGQLLGQALVNGISFLLENQEQFVAIMTKVALGLGAAALAITGLLVVIAGQLVAGFIAGIIEALGGGELEVATFNELSTIFSNIASDFGTIAQFVAEEIGQWLTQKVAEIIPTLISVFGESFVAAGAAMIDGLIVGIQSKISELGTTISQIGFIITQTVKEALGIASDSTVFIEIGLNIIQGLIQGITNAAGELPGLISGIIGSLFGGGEEGGGGGLFTFDPAEMLAGLAQVTTAFTAIGALITTIATTTIPILSVMLVKTAQLVQPLWMAFNQVLVMINAQIMLMYTVTLIELQATSDVVTQAMVEGFTRVSAAVLVLIGLITQLISQITVLIGKVAQLAKAFTDLGKKAAKAANDIAKAFNKIKSAADKSIQVINALATAWGKVAAAANRAARASRGAAAAAAGGLGVSGGNLGARQGLGFKAGTLGFKVPPNFPNDTFPINVTTGEKVVVSPPGKSIEEVIAPVLSNRFKQNLLSLFSTVAPISSGTMSATNTNITNNINISIANNNGSGFTSDAQMAQSVRMNMVRALT